MRILMMTNSYSPYTGGVEQSIKSFTERFRQRGHSVLIVAPESDEPVDDESDVVRVSAIKNFNDTNFPVTIPLPGVLTSRLEAFEPEVVHSHFPFIIGSSAMRVAASYEIPLVFTYHTMYERYIHYINADSDRVKAFVKRLTAGYANLCDLVIAPSRTVEQILRSREVEVPIEVIPTGVDAGKFQAGDGLSIRRRFEIPEDRFVVGHVGRLATEKNLEFLMQAVCLFLKKHREAFFLIAGDGPCREDMEAYLNEQDIRGQVVFAGVLTGQALVDAYHAMDLFVFSSTTETQGMVLAEAMAAGVPVAALEGSGVTDILEDGRNGFMIGEADAALFAERIEAYAALEREEQERMQSQARQTADHFSLDACAGRVLEHYKKLIGRNAYRQVPDESAWQTAMDLIKAEWEIFLNYANAAGSLFTSTETKRERDDAAQA